MCVQCVKCDNILEGVALVTWKGSILDLSALHEIPIPRCYFQKMNEKLLKHQLYGFSDASSNGSTAVVYLGTIHSNEEIDVILVASKTKQCVSSSTVDEFCSESVGLVNNIPVFFI